MGLMRTNVLPAALVISSAVITIVIIIITTILIKIKAALPALRSRPRSRAYPNVDISPDVNNDDNDNVLPDLGSLQSTYLDTEPTSIAIVLGSGGHTTEMFFMLECMARINVTDNKVSTRENIKFQGCGLGLSRWTHRRYIVGEEDDRSKSMVHEFEERMGEMSMMNVGGTTTKSRRGSYDIVSIPRARNIHQPLWTSPFSALATLYNCFQALNLETLPPQKSKQIPSSTKQPSRTYQQDPTKRSEWDPQATDTDIPFPPFPNLILSNGPANGAITILAATLLRAFGGVRAQDPNLLRSIYVESWARVTSLSLSGRLVLPLVDRFLVQWDSLLPHTKGKGEYVGFVVL